MRDFRFSVNVFGITVREALQERCRRAERPGTTRSSPPDHLGAPAPFPLLRRRGRGHRAPAGRHARAQRAVLEPGAAGPRGRDDRHPHRRPAGARAGRRAHEVRVRRRRHPVGAVRCPGPPAGGDDHRAGRRFFATDLAALPGGRPAAGPAHRLRGIRTAADRRWHRRPDPAVAAGHADIIGIAGVYQVQGNRRARSGWVPRPRPTTGCGSCGSRRGERGRHRVALLVQTVVPTDDRRAAAAELISRFDGEMSVDEALETPVPPHRHASRRWPSSWRPHRERYGFSYVTVHDPYLEAFAPVVERVRSTS